MEVSSTYDYMVSLAVNLTARFNTDENEIENLLWKPWVIVIVLTSIAGLITNGIVITAICKKSYKKSAWDVLFIWYCVLNMCLLIDFMLTAILPTSTWLLPGWMCPVYQFYSVFVKTSIYSTLAGHSFVNLVFYKDIDMLVIFASIFISAAISVPVPIFSRVIHVGYVFCTSDLSKAYNIASLVLTLIIPIFAAVLMSMLFFVIKIASKKVTKGIILRVAITVIFVIFWSPSWILEIMNRARAEINYTDIYALLMTFGWLICFGCCLHPLAFLVLNQSARQSLCCCRHNRNTRYELADIGSEETVQDHIMLRE